MIFHVCGWCMDSFSSDDILSDDDDEMPCHKIRTEIAVSHHSDTLNAC